MLLLSTVIISSLELWPAQHGQCLFGGSLPSFSNLWQPECHHLSAWNRIDKVTAGHTSTLRIRRDALAGYGWMFSTKLAENDINKVVKVDGFIFPGPSPSDKICFMGHS